MISSELMTETGALRFMIGLNALAAGYDANGNMTLRLKDGARYFLGYDAENRLTTVSGTVSASFVYNGDGQRVSASIDTTITTYIGGYFEWKDGTGTSYYFAGAQRIAMRTGTEVKYLLGDHLGSTAVTASATGAFDTETRYYAWGEVRLSSGTSPTDYQFTGQQNVASIGLYFYNARWYDSYLNRWIQPDSIIPQQQGTQAWDRYAYVNNSPVMYTDPTGHLSCDDIPWECGSQGIVQDTEYWTTQDWINAGVIFEASPGLAWTEEEIFDATIALNMSQQLLGNNTGDILRLSEGLVFLKVRGDRSRAYPGSNSIHIVTRSLEFHGVQTMAHEIGHMVDSRIGDFGYFSLADWINEVPGWSLRNNEWVYDVNIGGPGVASSYALENPSEDFVETWTSIAYSTSSWQLYPGYSLPDINRTEVLLGALVDYR